MNVLITGASQGIGYAIAKELHAQGHSVFLAARNAQRLQEAAVQFGQKDAYFAGDLAEPGQIQALAAAVQKHGFSPDALVLCAASFGSNSRSVVTPPVEELRSVFETNVAVNYQLVQTFLPDLLKAETPRIVLIGSTASIRAQDSSIYAVSKWALRSYAYGLRNELKEKGIGVTLLNPGGTFTQKRIPNDETPAGRLLESQDIAKLTAALFTLSPQAVVEELNVRPMLGDTY